MTDRIRLDSEPMDVDRDKLVSAHSAEPDDAATQAPAPDDEGDDTEGHGVKVRF